MGNENITPLTRATRRYVATLDGLAARILKELGAGIGEEVTSTKSIRKSIRIAAGFDQGGDPTEAMQKVQMAWEYNQARIEALKAAGVDAANPVEEEIGAVLAEREKKALSTIGQNEGTPGLAIEDILSKASFNEEPAETEGTPRIEDILRAAPMTGGA